MNVCCVSGEQLVEIQLLGFSTSTQSEPASASLPPAGAPLSLEKDTDRPSAHIQRPGPPDRPENQEEASQKVLTPKHFYFLVDVTGGHVTDMSNVLMSQVTLHLSGIRTEEDVDRSCRVQLLSCRAALFLFIFN